MEIVHIFLFITIQMDWPILQLYVKSAFLNGDLEKEVFVYRLEGYEVNGKEDMMFKLNKALYGLRQAPRAWYSKIAKHFSKLGF